VVSTKVLTPRQAVTLAALTNLVGRHVGHRGRQTISSGLIDSKLVTMTSDIMICALLAALCGTWSPGGSGFHPVRATP